MNGPDDSGARFRGAFSGRHGVRPASAPLPSMASTRLADATKPAACNDNTGLLHLAEVVPVVRQRLGIANDFPDELILASLKVIAEETTDRDRWRVAFSCKLALWLSSQGRELGRALTTVLSLLPPPRN
ncbi:MAG: hypothetical protein AAFV45_09800 [Pseudomonadota bacterium]